MIEITAPRSAKDLKEVVNTLIPESIKRHRKGLSVHLSIP